MQGFSGLDARKRYLSATSIVSIASRIVHECMRSPLGEAAQARSAVTCILEHNLPSVVAEALQQTLRDAAACPTQPASPHERQADMGAESSGLEQLLAALKSVTAIVTALQWCIYAAEDVLVDKGQSPHTRKQGVALLTQLCDIGIWQAVSDACSRLLVRMLLPVGSSTPASPPGAEATGRWAEVMQLEAVGRNASDHTTPTAEDWACLEEEGRLALAAVEVLASSCKALHVLTAVVRNACLTAPHEGGPAVLGHCLDSLCRSSVLDMLCGALLRLDPARPPSRAHGEAVVAFVRDTLRRVLGTVGMLAACASLRNACACCRRPRGQCSKVSNCPEDHAAWLDGCQRCLQAVSAPSVLQLVHAAAECFLQDRPPPPLAVAAGPPGRPRPSGLPQAQAAAADPATAAFLPSSSPADELSNKMLQRLWPLLAVCPFARDLRLEMKGEEGVLRRAALFLSALLPLWVLPFKEPGCHPAIKAALPGLSGFCRIAARAGRWVGYIFAVAEGQPGLLDGAACQEILSATSCLPEHVSSWATVRTGHSSSQPQGGCGSCCP